LARAFLFEYLGVRIKVEILTQETRLAMPN